MTERDTGSAKVVLGRTLGFLDDPADVGEAASHRFEEQGALVVGPDGRIVWSGGRADLPDDFARLPGKTTGRPSCCPASSMPTSIFRNTECLPPRESICSTG